jgi:RNA polymerase sigma-B factor
MKRHVRDRALAVRLPRRLHEASTRLAQTRQELTTSLGRDPSGTELAAALGISGEDLARIEAASAAELDEAAEGGAPEDVDASNDRIALAGAFQVLDETDRQIVYMRFVKELSRRETARELGISEASLARRSEGALARLRTELEGRGLDAAAPAAAAAAAPPERVANRSKEREARHSGRLLLRMPQTLHADLADAAEREDVSLNQFITNALAAAVGWGRDVSELEAQAPPPRWLPAALVTNIVVVIIAAVVALALLVVALAQGL